MGSRILAVNLKDDRVINQILNQKSKQIPVEKIDKIRPFSF
jgi:hypothetical protein